MCVCVCVCVCVYKPVLALNDLLWLICHKTKSNQTNYIVSTVCLQLTEYNVRCVVAHELDTQWESNSLSKVKIAIHLSRSYIIILLDTIISYY